jgi:hypothetical protein
MIAMKKSIYVSAIIISFVTGFYNRSIQKDHYDYLGTSLCEFLLPCPDKIEFREGYFQLTDSTCIFYNDIHYSAYQFTLDRFIEMVNRDSQFIFQRSVEKRIDGFAFYFLNDSNVKLKFLKPFVELKNLGEQGYYLSIETDCIKITANTSKALFWGMMTLRQIFMSPVVKNGAVPCLEIEDKPRYKWRGFQIDAARAPFSVASIKRVIRACSAFKMNMLLYREGDDELNAVKYDSLPIGHNNPEALTMSQIKDLIDYANKYNIDFIPEIESLGHVSAKALHYPELIEGGFKEEYWKNFSHRRKANFIVDKPGTYQVLEKIFEEWFPVLTTPMVHLGLDEVNLPVEKQSEHLKKLLATADRVGLENGKKFTFLVWSDAPPHPDKYDEQVIRCLWSYGDGGDISYNNKNLVKQGIKEFSTEGNKQTVFMAGGSGSKHFPYVFDGPQLAFKNIAQWAIWGRNRDNFKGLYAVQWHGNSIDLWFPNFLITADFGWNPPGKVPDIEQGLEKIETHLNSILDIEAVKPEEMNRPAWDGIWLDGHDWGQDIVTGEIAKSNKGRWKDILYQNLKNEPQDIKFTGDYFQFTPYMRIHYSRELTDESVLSMIINGLQKIDDDIKYKLIADKAIDVNSIFIVNEYDESGIIFRINSILNMTKEQAYSILISNDGVKVEASNHQNLKQGVISLQQILTSPIVKYRAVPGFMLNSK